MLKPQETIFPFLKLGSVKKILIIIHEALAPNIYHYCQVIYGLDQKESPQPMKNLGLYIFLLFLLQSACKGPCPNSQKVEFDTQTKTIKVLSSGYHITDVVAYRYQQMNGYISAIDTSYFQIWDEGKNDIRELNMLELDNRLTTNKIPSLSIINYDSVKYLVYVENLNESKSQNDLPLDEIGFVITKQDTGKLVFGSSHCCL
ncbi:MAG: hypothetical protein AB8F95_21820 [Bacteroidia bacterium]